MNTGRLLTVSSSCLRRFCAVRFSKPTYTNVYLADWTDSLQRHGIHTSRSIQFYKKRSLKDTSTKSTSNSKKVRAGSFASRFMVSLEDRQASLKPFFLQLLEKRLSVKQVFDKKTTAVKSLSSKYDSVWKKAKSSLHSGTSGLSSSTGKSFVDKLVASKKELRVKKGRKKSLVESNFVKESDILEKQAKVCASEKIIRKFNEKKLRKNQESPLVETLNEKENKAIGQILNKYVHYQSILKPAVFNTYHQAKFIAGKFFNKTVVVVSDIKNQNSWNTAKSKAMEMYENHTPQTVKNKVTDLQNGINQEFYNVKTVWNLNQQKKKGLLNKNSSYKELMAFNDFKRDKLKTSGVMVCSVVPGGFFLLSVPVLLFPRQCLPPSFWSESQQRVFYQRNHAKRMPSMRVVARHIQHHQSAMTNEVGDGAKRVLTALCRAMDASVTLNNSILKCFKPLCRLYPFDMSFANIEVQQAFCKIVGVSSSRNTNGTTNDLVAQVAMIKNLDDKLSTMDLDSLTEGEVLAACYMRGLNAGSLSKEANIYWLKNWIELSRDCDKSDTWFLLHAMVLYSLNYKEHMYASKVYGGSLTLTS